MGGPRTSASGPGAEQQTVLQGVVQTVTYQDPSTRFSVLRIQPEKGFGDPDDLFGGPCTAVGRGPETAAGFRVRLTGTWGTHASYGRRFEFEAFEHLTPLDREGLVRYLASKAFEGIGETLAERIVEHLGVQALERIQADPTVLQGVRGLRPAVAKKLALALAERAATHKSQAFLRGVGLGPQRAQAVLERLGGDCEDKVRQDPYRLADVPGLGFPTADHVARQLGLSDEDPRRVSAGLLAALERAADEGHTHLARGALVAETERLLGGSLPPPVISAALDELEGEGRLVADRELAAADSAADDALPIYLPWLAASERGLARSIARLVAAPDARPLASERDLATLERSAGLELHADQRAAILGLLATPIGLLTGGPGVGKTTIVRMLATLAERAGAEVLLASPTGRAAKRLAEATQRSASTIHRLLGYDPGRGGFERDAERPLRAGLVVVDEISMLDVVLAHHLLKAVRAPTRLVLIGDPNQLPSVGPGSVLGDLLAEGHVPSFRLTRIFRQEAESLIVQNAHRMLEGRAPELPARGERADFYLFPAEDPHEAADLLVDVVTRRIPETFGYRWQEDVQVLAPMYRGECGVDALNERLRAVLGVGGREVVRGTRRWRLGDRVIHVRNDYEKQVFNGDMGFIMEVSAQGAVTVRYPEQDVVYRGSELSDLQPAFAITVHRSQGGEFPAVVMPLVMQHALMLRRNLLYTAITRARELVVLVGSRRALARAIANDREHSRESGLAQRLARLFEGRPGAGAPGGTARST